MKRTFADQLNDLERYALSTSPIPSKGNTYYVRNTGGSNDFDGTSWERAKATIQAAYALCTTGNGDVIYVEAATYDLTALGSLGLQIAKNDVSIVFVGTGGVLKNTDTTNGGSVLQVTGSNFKLSNCLIQKGEVVANNVVVVLIDGATRCTFLDVIVLVEKTDAVGIKLDNIAYAFIMLDTGSGRCAVTATPGTRVGTGIYASSSQFFSVPNGASIGSLETGIKLGASGANSLLGFLTQVSNCDIGIELEAGASGNFLSCFVLGCTSNYVDNSGVKTNVYTGSLTYLQGKLDEILPDEGHHEYVYPFSDGEGTAGNPIVVSTNSQDETHGASTRKDYYSEPMVVIPPSTLTSAWSFLGVKIQSTTTGKSIGWCAAKISTISSAKNGGNDWNEGATVLTVVDGSKFQAGDYVWIYSSYKTDGEMLKVTSVLDNVVTIERETVFCACTGLRWNHTTNGAGTEVMYLACRPAEDEYAYNQGLFSAASAKETMRHLFRAPKAMKANDGLVVRAINLDDNVTATFELNALYE